MIPGISCSKWNIAFFFWRVLGKPKGYSWWQTRGWTKFPCGPGEVIHDLWEVRHIHHNRHKGRNPTKNFHLFFIHFWNYHFFSFKVCTILPFVLLLNSSLFFKCYRTVKCHNQWFCRKMDFFSRVFSSCHFFDTCLTLCKCDRFHFCVACKLIAFFLPTYAILIHRGKILWIKKKSTKSLARLVPFWDWFSLPTSHKYC